MVYKLTEKFRRAQLSIWLKSPNFANSFLFPYEHIKDSAERGEPGE
jgi:hypothetical protein